MKDTQYRDFMLWLSDTWNEIVDGDASHFAAGTSIEKMRSVGAAIRYVSGYASKTDQTLPGQKVGRYWGVVGKERIPWGKQETLPLDPGQAKLVMRTLRRYIMAVNRQSRIRIVARQLRLSPCELETFGGWFQRQVWRRPWGKHLRACGGRMPKKLRLRNLNSMNVFLDAEFWLGRLPRLLALQ